MTPTEPGRSLGRRIEDAETISLLLRAGRAILQNRWILTLLIGTFLGFVVIPNPVNRFTRLEGQIKRDSAFTVGRVLDIDLKVGTVQTQQESTQSMVESIMVLDCLRDDRVDLAKAGYPCARLFQKRGIQAP